MSWVPPDLSEACAVHTTLTTCQPQTFLFLQLVASIFGYSKDSQGQGGFGSFDFHQGFLNFFDHGFSSNEDFTFPQEHTSQEKQEYDFIVVGAGSAGCVVANRLSEVPHWRVLLLEAGDEEPEAADVPAFAPMLQRSSIDWRFMTQPSAHSCLARSNGQCAWARGKVMGGSSTINYMIYIRGHPRDYDEWAEEGNHGWSYREVFPYFLKSEDNKDLKHENKISKDHRHNPEIEHFKTVEPHYHNVGGYLSVGYFPFQDDNIVAFLSAYKELGLTIFDQNAEHQIGASLLQHTQHKGKRESANTAFIRPIRRKRKNLVVQTRSHALRVLIDPHSKVAFGVEYLKDGQMVQAIAKKEVIVSCGTIMSPKLLMLSGVGPAEELEKFGINVIKDLPVGHNLHDHTTVDGVLFSLSNHTSTLADDEQMREDVYLYRDKKDGPLASTGPLQANAFVQTKYEYEHDRPDIQFSLDAANVQNFVEDPILAAETGVLPLAYYDGIMARPILLNPKSRGVIRLNDSDPIYGHPLIFANTFYEQIDLLRIVEGMKQSLNLLKTHSLQKIGVSLVTNPLPHCEMHKFGTDEYWACVAVYYTTTIYHFVGTCKMGPKEDEKAVVDPHLRVYGIKNLRVIDASIMPKIVRGNTNAPTMMIGEKGSDLIKATWLEKGEFDKYSDCNKHHSFDSPFFKK